MSVKGQNPEVLLVDVALWCIAYATMARQRIVSESRR